MVDRTAELLLMQITDPTFPIGAYAHSYGLETYVQCGAVVDAADAAAYVARQITEPLCYTELLGMRLAYEYARSGKLTSIAELEDLLAAYKAPFELREASRKLAARFCRTAMALLEDLRQDDSGDLLPAGARLFAAYAGTTSTHMLNSAYGVFAQAASIPLEPLLRRYLYAQVSALVTTCVKTVPLSQTVGQRIVRRSYCVQQDAVACALAATPDDLCRAAPGFDIRSIEHETLYSRLFMS